MFPKSQFFVLVSPADDIIVFFRCLLVCMPLLYNIALDFRTCIHRTHSFGTSKVQVSKILNQLPEKVQENVQDIYSFHRPTKVVIDNPTEEANSRLKPLVL